MKRLIPFLFLFAVPAMAQRGGAAHTTSTNTALSCVSSVAVGAACSGYNNAWCVDYAFGIIYACNPTTHQWNTVGSASVGPATDVTCTSCINLATEIGTFSSATIASRVTDETGNGLLVFGTSPTLTTPIISNPAISGLTASRCLHTDGSGNVVVASGDCTTTGGTGTVTSIATTAPITGGTITTTGTIACATCTTNAAALTASRIVLGAGSQATSVLGSLGTATTLLHGNAAGAPTFSAVDLAADVTGTLPAASVGTGLTDAQVSNTLQCSLFVGSGSTTDAIDLASAEAAGTLPNSKTTAVPTSTASTIVTRDASADFSAHTVTVLSIVATGSADNTLGDEMTDNSANCADPASGNTSVCTIAGGLYSRDTGGSSLPYARSALSSTSGPAAWAANTISCATACTNIGMPACTDSVPLDGTNTALGNCTGTTGNRVCLCH